MLTSERRLQPGWSGVGAIAWLLAQVHELTAVAAVPLLVLACLGGVLRGAIDFSVRLCAVEWSLIACALVWIVCAQLGLDATRSAQLSMPALALLVLVPSIARERDASDAIAAMVWTIALLATAWSLALLAVGGDVDPATRVAAVGATWLVVPNDLAFVAVLWPLWLRAARDAPRRARIALLLMLVMQAAALFVLQSRLGLLLCAVALLPSAFAAWRLRRARIALPLFAFAAVLVPLMLLLFDKGARSLGARWELWHAGWDVFLRHPSFGVGPHNYVLAYRDALPALLDPRVSPWPHSLPIELLAETGVVGCLAAGALITSAALSMPAAMRRGAWLAVLAIFACLCFVEASTLRAWFWALMVIELAGASRQGIQGTWRNS